MATKTNKPKIKRINALWIKEEYIRDFKTMKVIGIIRIYENGDQAAVDFDTRQVLGYYRAELDHTTDFYGRVLTKGNAVQGLIYEKHKK